MKRVTDPALIKELDALSGTNNTSQAIPQTLQNPIQGSTNSGITNNPVFNFLTGAGGGIQNVLANLPYSPIPKAPPSEGVAGESVISQAISRVS